MKFLLRNQIECKRDSAIELGNSPLFWDSFSWSGRTTVTRGDNEHQAIRLSSSWTTNWISSSFHEIPIAEPILGTVYLPGIKQNLVESIFNENEIHPSERFLAMSFELTRLAKKLRKIGKEISLYPSRHLSVEVDNLVSFDFDPSVSITSVDEDLMNYLETNDLIEIFRDEELMGEDEE